MKSVMLDVMKMALESYWSFWGELGVELRQNKSAAILEFSFWGCNRKVLKSFATEAYFQKKPCKEWIKLK